MKPSWEDAPVWAKYLAMNFDSTWTWFESEPYFDIAFWKANQGKVQVAENNIRARHSLEERPND